MERSDTVSSPRARPMRPRRDRVAFSVARRTIFLLGAAGVSLGVGLFVIGFVLGRSERRPADAARDRTGRDSPARRDLSSFGQADHRSDLGQRSGVDPEPPGRLPEAGSSQAPPEPDPSPGGAREESEPDLAIEPIAPASGFGLQIGAYPKLEEADAYLRAHRHELRGLKIHVIPTVIQRRGVWHRIRVGVFASRAEAEEAKRALPGSISREAIVVGYR